MITVRTERPFVKRFLQSNIKHLGTNVKHRSYQDGLTEPNIVDESEFLPLVNPVFRNIYLIGALKNEKIPHIAEHLRESLGWIVFDDWHAAHPEADSEWQTYESQRGRSYEEALKAPVAQNVFQFDLKYLDRATHGLLVLPAGRSGHLELGYLAGRQQTTAILLDGDYDRWDVMYGFAGLVTRDIEEVIDTWKR